MIMKTLKSVLSLLLCLSLAVCLVACASSKDKANPSEKSAEDTTEDPICGGWTTDAPTEVTDEQAALFEKAMGDITGVSYTPVLYLGSQVVAGLNHRFLCKAQGVYPDAPETWAVVEIYEDLNGNAEVTDITDITDEEAAQYGVTLEAPGFGGGMQIANPFQDCESFADAEAIAGFAITAPDAVEGYPDRMIQAVSNDMIQSFYANGDMAEESTAYILLRKAVGSEDISGDYNEYGTVTELEVEGKTVTLKGEGDVFYVAIWTDGDYSYSVSVSDGADAETIFALVNSLS